MQPLIPRCRPTHQPGQMYHRRTFLSYMVSMCIRYPPPPLPACRLLSLSWERNRINQASCQRAQTADIPTTHRSTYLPRINSLVDSIIVIGKHSYGRTTACRAGSFLPRLNFRVSSRGGASHCLRHVVGAHLKSKYDKNESLTARILEAETE